MRRPFGGPPFVLAFFAAAAIAVGAAAPADSATAGAAVAVTNLVIGPCSAEPRGCAYLIEVASATDPTEHWGAQLQPLFGSVGYGLDEGLPLALAPGAYVLTATAWLVSDETAPHGFKGIAMSCATPFAVDPADQAVLLLASFLGTGCEVAAEVGAPSDTGIPPGVSCDEMSAEPPFQLRCLDAVRTAAGVLPGDVDRVVSVEFYRGMPCPGDAGCPFAPLRGYVIFRFGSREPLLVEVSRDGPRLRAEAPRPLTPES